MFTKNAPLHSRFLPLLALTSLLLLPHAFATEGGGEVTGTVKLAWDLSWEPNIGGYRVHYGLDSGTYTETVDVGYEVRADLPGLTVGQTYYSAVTAYNTAGLESEYSDEISFTVIAPPEARDTDGDGLSDLFETTYGDGGDLAPLADLDGDGLSALGEFAHGQNPNQAFDRPVTTMGTVEADSQVHVTIQYLIDPASDRFVATNLERSVNLDNPADWQQGQTVILSTDDSTEYPGLLMVTERSVHPVSAQRAEFFRLSYQALIP